MPPNFDPYAEEDDQPDDQSPEEAGAFEPTPFAERTTAGADYSHLRRKRPLPNFAAHDFDPVVAANKYLAPDPEEENAKAKYYSDRGYRPVVDADGRVVPQGTRFLPDGRADMRHVAELNTEIDATATLVSQRAARLYDQQQAKIAATAQAKQAKIQARLLAQQTELPAKELTAARSDNAAANQVARAHAKALKDFDTSDDGAQLAGLQSQTTRDRATAQEKEGMLRAAFDFNRQTGDATPEAEDAAARIEQNRARLDALAQTRARLEQRAKQAAEIATGAATRFQALNDARVGLNDTPYETRLNPGEEQDFQAWKAENAPEDSGADYDFRGAFKAGVEPAENGHWPDTFKKPNHPTFSNESIYAPGAPNLAGTWDGENYIPNPRSSKLLSTRPGVEEAQNPSLGVNGIVSPASLIRMKKQAAELQTTLDDATGNLAAPVRVRLKTQVDALNQAFKTGFAKQSPVFQKRINDLTRDPTLLEKVESGTANVVGGAAESLLDVPKFAGRQFARLDNAVRSGLNAMGADYDKLNIDQNAYQDYLKKMGEVADGWGPDVPDQVKEKLAASIVTHDLAKGVGGIGGMVAPGGVVGKLATIGKIGKIGKAAEAASGTAQMVSNLGMGSASTANKMRAEAQANPNTTPGQADAAEAAGGVLGLSLAAAGPLGNMVAKLSKTAAGKLFANALASTAVNKGPEAAAKFVAGAGKPLLERAIDTLGESAGFGLQQTSQTIGENLAAVGVGFDPDRPVLKGAAEAGASGLVLGALLRGVKEAHAAVAERRGWAKPEPPPAGPEGTPDETPPPDQPAPTGETPTDIGDSPQLDDEALATIQLDAEEAQRAEAGTPREASAPVVPVKKLASDAAQAGNDAKIEDLLAKGFSPAEAAAEAGTPLATVHAVRAARGIPSSEDPAALEAWKNAKLDKPDVPGPTITNETKSEVIPAAESPEGNVEPARAVEAVALGKQEAPVEPVPIGDRGTPDEQAARNEAMLVEQKRLIDEHLAAQKTARNSAEPAEGTAPLAPATPEADVRAPAESAAIEEQAPELMSPAEAAKKTAGIRSFDTAFRNSVSGKIYNTGNVHEWPPGVPKTNLVSGFIDKATGQFLTRSEHHAEVMAFDKAIDAARRYKAQEGDAWDAHEVEVVRALKAGRPVSSEAVDAYKTKLPPGYVRQGNRYVYKADEQSSREAPTAKPVQTIAGPIESGAEARIFPSTDPAKPGFNVVMVDQDSGGEIGTTVGHESLSKARIAARRMLNGKGVAPVVEIATTAAPHEPVGTYAKLKAIQERRTPAEPSPTGPKLAPEPVAIEDGQKIAATPARVRSVARLAPAKKLKVQREFLSKAARDAAADAPAMGHEQKNDLKAMEEMSANLLPEAKKSFAEKYGDFVTIEVPDDGTFRIQNTKESLAEFADKVDKKFGRGLNAPKTSVRELPRLTPEELAEYRVPKGSKGEDTQMSTASDKNLLTVHNTNEERLKKILKLGGMAVPSVAIVRNDKGAFTSFGDITLVAKNDLIDPQRSRANRVFNADVYSPRFPTTKTFLTPADEGAIKKRFYPAKEGLHNDVSSSWGFSTAGLAEGVADEGIERTFRDHPLVKLAWAKETNNPVIQKIVGMTKPQDVKDALTRAAFIKEDSFNRWAREEAGKLALNPDEKMRNGYDRNGNPRYKALTLETAVRELNKAVRDAEGFTYGVGNLRAKVAKQFRSVEGIKADRDQVIGADEMKALKEKTDAQFLKLAEDAAKSVKAKGSLFGFLDSFVEHIREAIDTGNWQKVFSEYYNEGYDWKPVSKFVESLRSMPTEYFEAKLGRSVDVGEFSAALIPDSTSPEMRAALQKKGLRLVEYKKSDPADRARAMKEVSDLAFSTGISAESSVDSASPAALKFRDAKLGEVPEKIRETLSGFQDQLNEFRKKRGEPPASLEVQSGEQPRSPVAGGRVGSENTRAAEAFRRGIGLVFGKNYVFFRSSRPIDQGAITSTDRANTAFFNVDRGTTFVQTAGHELTHQLKTQRPDLWKSAADTILKNNPVTEEYRALKRRQGYAEHQVVEEWLGDVVGERFAEPEFWDEVAKADTKGKFKQLAQAALDFIDRIIRRAKNALEPRARAQFINDLARVRQTIAEALVKYAEGAPYAENPSMARSVTDASMSTAKNNRKQSLKIQLQEHYRELAKEEFPSMPDGSADDLAEYLSGSRGVMQSEEMSSNEAMRRAVRAYIRHNKTSYETNFDSGVERSENRAMIGKTVDAIYSEWREGWVDKNDIEDQKLQEEQWVAEQKQLERGIDMTPMERTAQFSMTGEPPQPPAKRTNEKVPDRPDYFYRMGPDTERLAGLPVVRQMFERRGQKPDLELAKTVIDEIGVHDAAALALDQHTGLDSVSREALIVETMQQAAADAKGKIGAEREKLLRLIQNISSEHNPDLTMMGQTISMRQNLTKLDNAAGVIDQAVRDVTNAQNAQLGGKEKADGDLKDVADALNVANQKGIEANTAALNKALRTVKVGKELWQRYRDAAAAELLAFANGRTDAPAKRAPIQQFVKNLTAELKSRIAESVPDKNAGAKPEVTAPMDVIKDALANPEKYKEAWETVREKLTEKYGEDSPEMQTIDLAMANIGAKPYGKAILDRAIKEAHADLGTTVSAIAKEHWTNARRINRDLADALVDEAGLKPADALRVATDLANRMNEQTAAAKTKALARLEKKHGATKRTREIIGAVKKAVLLNNLGALSVPELRNAVAKELNLRVLTDAEAAKLTELADKAATAPNDMAKARAELNVLKQMKVYKGSSTIDLLTSFWYANALSSPATHIANTMGNTVGAMFQTGSMMAANPMRAGNAMTGFMQGLRTGLTDARSMMTTGQGLRDFSDKVGGIEGAGQTLEQADVKRDLPKWVPGKPLIQLNAKILRYVGRAMRAADSMFFHAAKDAYLNVATAKMLAAEFHGKELRDKVRETLSVAPDVWLDAHRQATEEGWKGSDLTLRVAGLIQKARAQSIAKAAGTQADSITEGANLFGAQSTLNQTPEGLAGVVYQGMSHVAEHVRVGNVPVMKPFLMFLKVPTNLFNNSLNLSPIGAMRAWHGSARVAAEVGKPGAKAESRQYDADERARMYAQSVIGTTLMGMLAAAALSGDDDDREKQFDITAKGPDDFNHDQQLQQTGWRPYSIKVGDRWVSYKDSSMVIPMALVGHMVDAVRYRKPDEKELQSRLMAAVRKAPAAIFDTSMLQGLGSLGQWIQGKTTPDQAATFFSRQAVGMQPFVPATNLLSAIDRSFDTTTRESDAPGGALTASVPFARRLGTPRLDQLGDTIERSPLDRFASNETHNPLREVLRDKRVFISTPSKTTMLGKVPMTPEQYRSYTALRGQGIYSRLAPMANQLRSFEPERVEDIVQKIEREEAVKAKELVRRGMRFDPSDTFAGRQ